MFLKTCCVRPTHDRSTFFRLGLFFSSSWNMKRSINSLTTFNQLWMLSRTFTIKSFSSHRERDWSDELPFITPVDLWLVLSSLCLLCSIYEVVLFSHPRLIPSSDWISSRWFFVCLLFVDKIVNRLSYRYCINEWFLFLFHLGKKWISETIWWQNFLVHEINIGWQLLQSYQTHVKWELAHTCYNFQCPWLTS